MGAKRWMIDWRLEKAFKRMAPKFVKDVAIDMQDDFVNSILKWEKKFKTWNSSHHHHGHGFDFLLKASDQYGGNYGNVDVFSPDDDNFQAGLNLSPERMNAGLIHAWYPRIKGKPFKDKIAFEMMYGEGIYGYNRDIVMKKWYKTKKSIKNYFKKYPYAAKEKKYQTRWNVIRNILRAGIIPPKAKKSPNDIMIKTYGDKAKMQKRLDEKIKPYLQEMMREIADGK